MADVQLAVIEQQDTQLTLSSPSETQVTVAIPGVQGAVGAGVAPGGSTGQSLVKNSGADYDTTWQDMATIGLAAGLSIALG